eukprot:TRINITY_DN19737_c0_g1_i1.p1 TRINITY_DN19737_c0_g1~~TRINITY_DN19737_c0_g1_i1.p1  ORF type:complete len:112 (+),score=10.97 TRINITY_DN19737_c0_g1_i1:148-483(+)
MDSESTVQVKVYSSYCRQLQGFDIGHYLLGLVVTEESTLPMPVAIVTCTLDPKLSLRSQSAESWMWPPQSQTQTVVQVHFQSMTRSALSATICLDVSLRAALDSISSCLAV